MPVLRRKRLPDGSFGPLEKVFEGETDTEKIARLEQENASLMLALVEKEMRISEMEEIQAEILLKLVEVEVNG